jgi:uncharacterized spore protein YtfJ
MEADIQRLLDAFEDIRKEANVNACFGKPVSVEGRTVIPIARVGYGFGMGAGEGPTAELEAEMPEKEQMGIGGVGGGGGGGMTSSPLGVVEITAQGTRVEPIIDQQKVAIASMLVGAWSVFWLSRALMAIFSRKE